MNSDIVKRVDKNMINFDCEKLKKIKLLITDVDGVLTDGGIYYDSNGECLKKFNVRDGLGIRLLMESGVKVAILSGRDSEALRKRIKDLDINIYSLGITNKEEGCRSLMKHAGVTKDETAYIGDDSIDLPAFEVCSLSFTVFNAPEYIKEKADAVLNAKGGEGALRELADYIMFSQGNSYLYDSSSGFKKIKSTVSQ